LYDNGLLTGAAFLGKGFCKVTIMQSSSHVGVTCIWQDYLFSVWFDFCWRREFRNWCQGTVIFLWFTKILSRRNKWCLAPSSCSKSLSKSWNA